MPTSHRGYRYPQANGIGRGIPCASVFAASPGSGPGRFPPTSAAVLTGKIRAVGPGHSGGNSTAPAIINCESGNGEPETLFDPKSLSDYSTWGILIQVVSRNAWECGIL